MDKKIDRIRNKMKEKKASVLIMLSVENVTSSDVISFELERTDATNAMYPFSLTIHYLTWCLGNLATLEE